MGSNKVFRENTIPGWLPILDSRLKGNFEALTLIGSAYQLWNLVPNNPLIRIYNKWLNIKLINIL